MQPIELSSMFGEKRPQRVSTKRAIGKKHMPQKTTSIDETEKLDSALAMKISIYSFQNLLMQQNVSKQAVIHGLKEHIAFLTHIRHVNYQKFKSLEDSCHSTTQENPIYTHRRVTFETDARPTAPAFQTNDQNSSSSLHGKSNIKSTMNLIKAHPKRMNSDGTPHESTRNMNSSTIWNNVNKFFTITPTVEHFKNFLTPVKLPDTNIQLGQHYSISVNQKLKLKYKNGNVQLRLPPAIVETPEQTEISPTVVFHRLLSSFIPCDEATIPEDIQKMPSVNLNFSNLNPDMFPVNHPGTSTYSMLPFEQKLVLEVKSIGLVPDASGPKLTDNEVMNDIIESTQEYKEIIEENNKSRNRILKILEEKEEYLLQRAERAKKWSQVNVKPESAPKNNQKRPKNRDKIA